MQRLTQDKYLTSPGNIFAIAIPENPTTGYSWSLKTTDGLRILSDQYMAPSVAMPGAGGKHQWRIQAANQGFEVIYGIYRRPWEPITGNEQTLALQVFIQ